MRLRTIENGKHTSYDREVSKGVWEPVGWGVFRDNLHRLVIIYRKRVKKTTIKVYEVQD
jgi:hypothetical protein